MKKILIGSGLRYDLAVESPEYVKELVTHHVGGYLKIAPEHTEGGPLSKMMKPASAPTTASSSCSRSSAKRPARSSSSSPLHRRPPRHHRRGHDEPGAGSRRTASAPTRCRPSTPAPWPRPPRCTTPANPLGITRTSETVDIVAKTPPPAQGLPALPRPQQLAAAARGLKAMGRGPGHGGSAAGSSRHPGA